MNLVPTSSRSNKVYAVDIIEEVERAIRKKIYDRADDLSEKGREYPSESELETIRMTLLPTAIEAAIKSYEDKGFTIVKKRWLETLVADADYYMDMTLRNHASGYACIDTTMQDIENETLKGDLSELLDGMNIHTQNPFLSRSDYNWAAGARGETASIIYGKPLFLETPSARDRRRQAKENGKSGYGSFSPNQFGTNQVEREIERAEVQGEEFDIETIFEKLPRKYLVKNQTYVLDINKTLGDAGLHSASSGYMLLKKRLENERDDPVEQDRLLQRYAEIELGFDDD